MLNSLWSYHACENQLQLLQKNARTTVTRNEHNMIELWSSIYVHGVHIKILIYYMFCWLLVLAPHGDQSKLLLCFVGVSASCLSRSVLGKTPGLFQLRGALILKLQVPPCEWSRHVQGVCAIPVICFFTYRAPTFTPSRANWWQTGNTCRSWSCAKGPVCTPLMWPPVNLPPWDRTAMDCQLPKNQRLDFQVIQATISSNPFSM